MPSVPEFITWISCVICLFFAVRTWMESRKMRTMRTDREKAVLKYIKERDKIDRGEQRSSDGDGSAGKLLSRLWKAAAKQKLGQRDQVLPGRRWDDGGDREEGRTAVRDDLPGPGEVVDDDLVELYLSFVDYCPKCQKKLSRLMYPKKLPEKFCDTMEHGVFIINNGDLILVPSGQA